MLWNHEHGYYFGLFGNRFRFRDGMFENTYNVERVNKQIIQTLQSDSSVQFLSFIKYKSEQNQKSLSSGYGGTVFKFRPRDRLIT